jgi:hypothetical protein
MLIPPSHSKHTAFNNKFTYTEVSWSLKPDYDNYIKQNNFFKNQNAYIFMKLSPLWQRYIHYHLQKNANDM